jgi:murein DD-endopeptidase MepM/ murein hydrolase activator NlpD
MALTSKPNRRDNGGGTGPAPFGGQTAVHSKFSSGPSTGPLDLLRGRSSLWLVGTILGSALLAITAATALPRGTSAAPRQIPHRIHHLALATHVRPSPAPEADVAAKRFTGRVAQDLTQSLRAAGVPDAQGRQYVAVLGRAIPLANGLSVDDRFDLVVERRPDGKLGQLLYVGLDRVARADVELMKWTDGKQMIWVNADGVGGEGSSTLGRPVNGRMTSPFGERFHPILGYMRFHKGVDLAAAEGTPIVAAADGRVVSAGWAGGYGRAVTIAHAGGIETRYGHMSRLAASSGEMVHRGEVIGYVGSSGLSTGPHLHFEVTRNGQPVNPMTARLIAGPGHLEGEKLHQFDATLRGLLLGSAVNG